MIEVRELTKRFTRQTVVDQVSFNVGQGEIVGFLGPNGAGKTTTMRMLTGYLPPTSGSISVAGFDVFRQSVEARRRIGYMPENVPLYDEMRVREYLKFRARLKGLSNRDARTRVNDVVDVCGLEPVRRKMIKVLSKGFRQRVGLADALIHSPELLILDEPTNGLDPIQIRQIRELIKRLGEKHTILLSTHILSEVEMTCGRVIIIDSGRICAQDTPRALVEGMRAAGRVVVEVAADPDAAREAIGGLDHVKRVTAEPAGDDDDDRWYRFEVLVDSGTDARERLHELITRKGWPLRDLHRHVASLEDVFVELTRRD
jgi:ABC-2 type transport system ATP-binding protein